MRKYTVLRRERKEMTRNDVDVGKDACIEHQPIPMNDPIDSPKFSVGVTVLPDSKQKA